MTKVCSICKADKDIEMFDRDKRSRGGRCHRCKSCRAEYLKEYYQNNKEHILQNVQDVYQYNKPDKMAYGREHYKNNKEEISKKNRDQHRKNPAKRMFRLAKERAEQKGVPFTIELEDIVVPEFCPILGIPIGVDTGRRDGSLSLDRIEPEKGYVLGNIAVVSDRANRIKNNGTAEEHIRIAEWMREMIAKAGDEIGEV